MIRSEGGKLIGFVFVDTDRPIADYVAECKSVGSRAVALPAGTRLAWVGQFEYFERAQERLAWVIPLTLGIVMLLRSFNTQSLVETAIVMLAVPFSLARRALRASAGTLVAYRYEDPCAASTWHSSSLPLHAKPNGSATTEKLPIFSLKR